MNTTKARRGAMTDADRQAAIALRKIWERQRHSLGLTQSSVGPLLGDIGQSAVSQYLNGKIPLGVEITLKWAAVLHVSPMEIRPDIKRILDPGTNNLPGGSDDHLGGTEVPIIEFATLADWLLSQDSGPAKTARNRMGCPVKHGSRTFCTQMTTTAMACGDERAIFRGQWCHIDPDKLPTHDCSVLATLANGEPVIAQYMSQAGREWLVWLNDQYPELTANFTVIGRVIYVGSER